MTMTTDNNLPNTVSEAVNKLLSDIPLESKHQIKNSSEEELINFHFGLGLSIRNEFGLWEKESILLEDCKQISGDSILDVDGASMIIIKALWERLQKFPPPKLVKGNNQYSY